MKRRFLLNVALLIVLLVVLGASWGIRPDPRQRHVEFLPGMVRPVSYEAFSENPLTPDGMTMQSPVPGTVLYKQMPLHFKAGPEEAIRAGLELRIPLDPEDEGVLERGQTVFGTFCFVCHGPEGRGDGLVSQRGMPMPPALFADNALKLPDGQIFHIISFGQNKMPGYRAQIEPQDRWAAIAYVRKLQKKMVSEATQSAPQLAPEAGEDGATSNGDSAAASNGEQELLSGPATDVEKEVLP